MRKDVPQVKVTGTSAAGKSTLVRGLRAQGIDARAAGQEHSQIPDMWQRLHPPQVLIYLEATVEVQRARRPDVTWTAAWLQVEKERLAHARTHADLHIETSSRTVSAVLELALLYLQTKGVKAGPPLPPRPRTGGVQPDLG